ncbi:MAG: type II toxin-antitoxin system HipA family toxin [Epsilonproteobacteria bacterium]|jgi:serine/threonine-protein kinase HipA|nr:type II toxin-antitoxin system HipA family toxin [Sulfurospirillum sp. 'SP']NCD12670.1 type II toxin-antitoxin system HipA family toxin [Campylobacterota bacterium]WNZ00414.1 type II toxin-antitoxin system HipA family toxin [Sulfurospirillum sp. 'SP']
MKDNLHVKVFSEKAGTILLENNEYIFDYTTENQDAFVSLTMPVRAKSYAHSKLHPIFEMHLPEGYLLSIIKKHFSKITKTDNFGLLKLMAHSIKGRLTYEANAAQEEATLSIDELLHPKSEVLFDELVRRFALNSPLSGVQPKVLAKVRDKVTLPLQEYIVKSWGDEYPHLALNEFYCMKVVKSAGIEVPEFYLSDDNKLFIMKRFDIKENGTYLGFEDMCVLQARQAHEKYEGSYESIAKTIKTFVSPKHKKKALRDFFKMMVINTLVQNGDAHLKNFGLLYENIQNIWLAPAYDVVCTTVYIQKDIPALHLLGSKKWWSKAFLIRFGKENCELSSSEISILYDECIVAMRTIVIDIKERIEREHDSDVKMFLSALERVFEKSIE